MAQANVRPQSHWTSRDGRRLFLDPRSVDSAMVHLAALRPQPIPAMNGLARGARTLGCLGLLIPPLGVLGLILGYKARGQIAARGERGDDEARTGIWLGWVAVVYIVVVLAIVIAQFGNSPSSPPAASAVPSTPGGSSPGVGGTWKLLRAISSKGIDVYDLAWSPDSTMVAASGQSTGDAQPVESRVWRVSNGALIATHQDQGSSVRSVRWSPDGKYVASAGSSAVQIWNARTGRTSVSIPEDETDDVSWSPDGRYIVLDTPGATEVRRAATGAKVTTLRSTGGAGNGAEWSPKGGLIVGGGIIWDGLNGKQQRAWARSAGDAGDPFTESAANLNDSIWSPDGRRILSYGGNANVIAWTEATGTTDWHLDVGGGHFHAAWSPDGKYVAFVLSSGPRIVNAASGKPLGNIDQDYFTNQVDAIAWSPNGKFVATVSGGTLQIWQRPS
jgi:WD40 repeat protein